MKKISYYTLLIFLFSISISNAQKTQIKISAINCMPASTFFQNHPSLHEGETLVIDIDYINVLSYDGGIPSIQFRMLNDYTPFLEFPNIVVDVNTSTEEQTVKLLFTVPKVGLDVQIDKIRLQAYAHGNKNTEGTTKSTVYGYSGPYNLD